MWVLPVALGADNGNALHPPMGWRSWNCFGADVTQPKMEQIMDKLAAKTRLLDGVNTSFVDLGYVNCGLDDNWQACRTGVHGSFDDADGNPLINLTTFPDMKKMTDHGHALGLRVGWYMNNCICREILPVPDEERENHYKNHVKALVDFGYDGVKFDECGEFTNLTKWYELINATGRGILIENCHWGRTVPGQGSGNGPCKGDTGVSDCPYNFYRTSQDIKNNWESMISNHESTQQFLGTPPLSRPGAWAYPDMMEVGRMASHAEDRTHFGLWVIISSPLVLGYDLNNDSITDRVWDIIGNKEAIAINQAWFGHPGKFVRAPAAYVKIWAKPVGVRSVAALVVNGDANTAQGVSIDLVSDLAPLLTNVTSNSATVRDVWQHKDAGIAHGVYKTDAIASHDSRLYVFTF